MSTADAIPRFNHVALSVPADDLDGEGRKRILEFYAEVFGFSEMPTMTRDRELLVLRCYSNEQFIYIHASDRPMQCGNMEHVGLSVSSPEELDAIYQRALEYKKRDDEVFVVDRKTDDFKVLKLHSFYVRYRLPFTIELQCFAWQEGFDAQSL